MKALLFVLIVSLSAWGQSMDKADQAYQRGQWRDAAQAYEAVPGPHSAALDYNLGNAYLQLGDVGRARLSYERALVATPRDPDLRANLARIDPQAGFPFVTRNEVLVLASLFWFLSAGLVASPRSRKLAPVAVLVSLVALLGAVSTGPGRRAIVLASEVQVLQGPGRDQPPLDFQLAAGTPVQIRDRQGDWTQVEALGHPRGWVRQEQVEAVGP